MKIKTTNLQNTRLNVHKNRLPCRHLENGRTVIPKICIYDYECWRCGFDQWLDELETQKLTPAVAA